MRRSRSVGTTAPQVNRSQSRPVVSPATFSPIRRRLGLNRLRNLGPAEPVRRYERGHSGGPDPGRYQKARQGDHIGQRLMDRTGQSSLRGRTAETDASVSSTSVPNSIVALYRSRSAASSAQKYNLLHAALCSPRRINTVKNRCIKSAL